MIATKYAATAAKSSEESAIGAGPQDDRKSRGGKSGLIDLGWREGVGFEEADLSVRILLEAVVDRDGIVKVGVQGGAEPVQERDGAELPTDVDVTGSPDLASAAPGDAGDDRTGR